MILKINEKKFPKNTQRVKNNLYFNFSVFTELFCNDELAGER